MVRGLIKGLVLAGVSVLGMSSATAQVQREADSPPKPDDATSGPPPAQPATASALPAKSVDSPPNPYARYDEMGVKGWITPFPSAGDTVLRDQLGIRPALADHGIGFLLLSINTGIYTLTNDHLPSRPQYYNGQRVTHNLGIQELWVTYDLGKIGLDGGQLFASGISLQNGFTRVNGPRTTRMGNLGWYQKLADGKVELKLGYYDNVQEYAGVTVAGSTGTGALGPQSLIPVQAGLGYNGISQPGANVRINFKGGFYTKFGVQRSVSPQGAVGEFAHNKSGLSFSVPGARALFIDEVGLKQASAPGTKQFWIRAGGIYNSSRFTDFRNGGKTDNWAAYAAVDRQLTQPDPGLPFRGLYIGGTVDYAPVRQNLYTQYYEGRVYGIGLLKSRPFDLATFVASYNKLSHDALGAVVPRGERRADYTASYIASYAYRLFPGIYLQPGLGVVQNSAYYPKVPTALNVYFGVTMTL